MNGSAFSTPSRCSSRRSSPSPSESTAAGDRAPPPTSWWPPARSDHANATAITGEYLSAASFLGVAGYVAKYGADVLWYPVGFTAGYLGLLMFVAAPLRRSGAYTVPDFAEFRLSSHRARTAAMLVVVLICVLYLIPQFQGAGQVLHILLDIPPWGAVGVGTIVIINVVSGRHAVHHLCAGHPVLAQTHRHRHPGAGAAGRVRRRPLRPGRSRAATGVDRHHRRHHRRRGGRGHHSTGVTVDGRVDGDDVRGQVLGAGTHTLGAGNHPDLDAGAATPVVTGHRPPAPNGSPPAAAWVAAIRCIRCCR